MNVFLKRALKKEAKKYLSKEQIEEIRKARSLHELSDDTLTELDNICLGFSNEIVTIFK